MSFVVVTVLLAAGCSHSEAPSADTGKPAPAVGSPTGNGGVITVSPQHGRRPHMGGG